MIVVPFVLASAVDGRVHVLRTIHIINDGTGTVTRRNYDVKLFGKAPGGRGEGRLLRTGRVEDWPSESRTPQDLLAEALASIGAHARKKSGG